MSYSPAEPVTTFVAPGNFMLATLTTQRMKQLKGGARPRVDVGVHKNPRVALLEVAAGFVSWSIVEPVVPAPAVTPEKA